MPRLSQEIIERVAKRAGEIGGVLQVEKCYVRKMGFDYYVDLHIKVQPQLTVQQGHAIAHQVKQHLLDSDLRIQNALIHIEPY